MEFRPRKIIDPKTGQERVVSVEEQMEMLKKGVLFDARLVEAPEEKKPSADADIPR